jgi:hypothetical protein
MRILNRRIRRVLTVAFLLPFASCTDHGPCELVGCDDEVEILFKGVPHQFTATYTGPGVNVVEEIDCTQTFLGCDDIRRYVVGAPPSLEVQVSWDDTTITRTFEPSYATYEPNGPHCDPKCRQASVIFER